MAIPKWLLEKSPEKLKSKFLDSSPKAKRILSDLREKRVADGIGGKVVPGSGCSLFAKGDIKDVQYDALLLEQKGTEGRGIRVEYDWIRKITKEAMAVNRIPGLVLSFDLALSPTDPVKPPPDWCMLPLQFVKELLEAKYGTKPV